MWLGAAHALSLDVRLGHRVLRRSRSTGFQPVCLPGSTQPRRYHCPTGSGELSSRWRQMNAHLRRKGRLQRVPPPRGFVDAGRPAVQRLWMSITGISAGDACIASRSSCARTSSPQLGHSSGNSSPTRASSLAQAIRGVWWERGSSLLSPSPSATCPPVVSSPRARWSSVRQNGLCQSPQAAR